MTSSSSGAPHEPGGPGPLVMGRSLGLAALAYAALSVALTWPLVAHLSTHLPHDLGDPVLSSWLLWWHAHHVPFTATWWDGIGFFPVHGSLALSDHRLGLSLIGSPIIWLGGGPIVAYNVALLLSFALSALTMHALVLVLSGRHDAALVAGLVFGFAPYRFDHIVHLELLSSYWLPVAALALHRWLSTKAVGWLAVFAGAWLVQALTCGYYYFFFGVLVALWSVWFLRSWRREILPLAAASAFTLLPLLPILLRYRSVHHELGLKRGIREIELFSADVSGLLSGAPWLAGTWLSKAVFRPEGQIYPGLVAVLLVAAAAVAGWRHRHRLPRSRARTGLLAIAGLALAVAASVPVLGPWRLAAGPVSVSVSQAVKPLSVAFFAAAAYALTGPALVDAYRRRSVFVFYAAATLVMWLLAFGPAPQLLGTPVLYKAPYAWLMQMPGFADGFRVPARFAMLAALCLAVAAGLALVRLRPVRSTAAVMAVLAAIMVAEVWHGARSLVAAPAPWHMPALPAEGVAVVELPLGGVAEDTLAIYHSIAHGRPVVNGYSGYDPPHYALLRLAAAQRDPRGLAALGTRTPLLIAIHQYGDHEAWEQLVRELPGAALIERSPTTAFYRVPRQEGDGANQPGAALPIRAVTASVAQNDVGRLRDGRLETAWITTGAQQGGEELVVELAGAFAVCGAGLTMGPLIGALPRQLEIDVSNDGRAWTPTWRGPTTGLAVDAALRDPARVDVRVPVAPHADTRFVRLRQTGQSKEEEWAVAEIAVMGCGS